MVAMILPCDRLNSKIFTFVHELRFTETGISIRSDLCGDAGCQILAPIDYFRIVKAMLARSQANKLGAFEGYHDSSWKEDTRAVESGEAPTTSAISSSV